MIATAFLLMWVSNTATAKIRKLCPNSQGDHCDARWRALIPQPNAQ